MMSDDHWKKKNVFGIKGGKYDKPEEDRVSAAQALREFADMIETMDPNGVVEVAGVALIPDVGVALCGNSETGNDGLNTMLDIGKTAVIMQYINEEYDDEPTIQ
jgi:hypothetical protein